jgi:hypothetical protein
MLLLNFWELAVRPLNYRFLFFWNEGRTIATYKNFRNVLNFLSLFPYFVYPAEKLMNAL